MDKDRVVTDIDFRVLATADVVRSRVSTYLVSAGYRRVSDDPLNFERGSRLGTPFAFTPVKWHSRVAVVVKDVDGASTVHATFDVSTRGQMVTEREALFWQRETENLERAARGETNVDTGKESAERVSGENLKLVPMVLICMMVPAVLGFAILQILPRSLVGVARFVIPIASIWCSIQLFGIFEKRRSARLAEEEKLPPPPLSPS